MIENEKSFLLSICVPTYNRPEELSRMLDGLLPQLNQNVELVFRDDSSNSDTQEVIRSRLEESQNCYQYYKGEKIGLDAASLFLLQKAKGDFVWYFSDDDEVDSSAVKEILKIISNNPNLSSIWVNFYNDLAQKIAINDQASRLVKDGSEILDIVGNALGLVSTQIFRRELGLNGLNLATRHIKGFSFASTAIFLFVLAESKYHYFSAKPLIIVHPTTVEEIKTITTKTGSVVNPGFEVYGVNFYEIVREFDGKFPSKSIRKLLARNFLSTWKGMYVGWIGGWDTPKGKKMKMLRYYWSYPTFWIAIFLFNLPVWLNRFFYRCYKVFFTEGKLIVLQNRIGDRNVR